MDSPYGRLLLRRAPGAQQFDSHMDDSSWAFFYPGSARRSLPAALPDGQVLMPTGTQLVLMFLPGPAMTGADAAAVAGSLRELLRRVRARTGGEWEVEPTDRVAPRGHPLSGRLRTDAGSRLTRDLTLQVEDGLWDPRLLGLLGERARTDHGHRLATVTDEDQPADAALCWVPFQGNRDDYSLLPELAARLQVKTGRTPPPLPAETGRFRDVQNWLLTAGIYPLAITPLLVWSNRRVRGFSPARWPAFEHIRESSGILKDRQLQNDALVSLGSAVQMFAHDVKKPFSMIQGYFNMLATAEPDRVHQLAGRYLPDIKKTIHHVDRLLADLMEMGAGASLYPEEVDPVAVLLAALEEVFAFEVNDHIELEWTTDHTSGVRADPQKLRRVFSNLLANARQAMGGRGRIFLRSCNEGDQVEITIGNSGSFIPEAARERLFDLFYTRGKKSGTGLGLAIVKKIVDAHNGRITCFSDPQKGTWFVISLPSAGLPPATQVAPALPVASQDLVSQPATAPSPSRPAGPDRVTILVVDDEPLYGDLVRGLLSGFADLEALVHVATDDHQAMHLATTCQPDVILLDIDMGRHSQNGFAIFEQLREQGHPALICFHSNRMSEADRHRARQPGGGPVISKPLTMEKLREVLETLSQEHGDALIIVDDDPFFIESWREAVAGSDLRIHAFASPEELIRSLTGGRARGRVRAVITDLYFDGVPGGLEVSAGLPDLPVLVCSDLQIGEETGRRFHGILPKDPLAALAELRNLELL